MRAAFALLLVCLLLAGLRLWQGGAVLHSDLLALLPQGTLGEASSEASRRLSEALQDDFVLLLRGPEEAKLQRAAEALLGEIDRVEHVVLVDPEQQAENFLDYVQALKSHRFALLTPAQELAIRSGETQGLVERALLALYSPAAMGRVASVSEDPLGLFGDYVLPAAVSSLDIYQSGELTRFAAGGLGHVLFHGRVIPGAFSLDAQEALLDLESVAEEVLAKSYPDVELLRGGAVFHGARASSVARREVGFIAAGSAIGIILLFTLAFRSPGPLLLSLSSVLFGCGSALLLCWNLFPNLHLITLVFGASLIGVAVDYSLHYLTRSGSQATDSSGPAAAQTLKFLLPGLLLALATSLVGFGSLLQASVPGLRQMAVFSMVGLASAWLYVVALFPLLAPAQTRAPARVVAVLAGLPDLSQRRRGSIAVLFAVPIVYGLSQLQLGTDLRLFHTPDSVLLTQQQRIQSVLPSYAPNQFYLVQAPTAEALLQRLEEFEPVLKNLRDTASIGSYQLLSDSLPSLARQLSNQTLLGETLYRPEGEAEQVLGRLGFDAAALASFQASVHATATLSPEAWLAMAPTPLAQGWLGVFQGQYYSLVLIGDVQQVVPLAQAASRWDWLEFVDTVGELSNSLNQQQRMAMGLLAVAYLLIGLVLLLRFRKLSALRLLLVPLTASLFALGILGIAGSALTLFHVFALFLVLGLGMDYSIFSYESGADRDPCLLAIFLSFATSALSFGLLALSNTPMIAAFGLTVLLGSLGNWLLVPLAGTREVQESRA